MAGTYIPRSDGSFDGWQGNFEEYVRAHYGDLGLSLGDADRLKAAREIWAKAYETHIQRHQAAIAARQAKDDEHRAYERLIREVVRRIQPFVKVTDAHRAALGITVRDAQPTPTGTPTTRPLVTVDFSKRLRHTLRYADESTPTRRARPRGTIGAEIWVKVAAPGEPPPTDPADLTFLQLSTRTPATIELPGEDGGKTAHYMVRWLSTRSEPGPWSETASATIGA